mmetsp:Transcript_33134/g.76552  ORF Transcript_33134/g.76552 Transcript_33134/m.76552 type:complete len:92 (-) Transcript_33134:1050-1325(-)
MVVEGSDAESCERTGGEVVRCMGGCSMLGVGMPAGGVWTMLLELPPVMRVGDEVDEKEDLDFDFASAERRILCDSPREELASPMPLRGRGA